MAHNEWRVGRIFLWWGVTLTVLVTLFAEYGTIALFGDIALSIIGAVTASLAVFEHGWLKAPYRMGTPIRAFFILGIICGLMAFVGFICLPRPSVTPPATVKQENVPPPKQIVPQSASPKPTLPDKPIETHRRKPLMHPESNPPIQSMSKNSGPKSPVTLTAQFVHPASLAIGVFNPSDDVVENVLWEMIAIRTSDLCFFSFATQSIGFIKPQSRSANYEMPLSTMQHLGEGCDGTLHDGDELTGSVSVDCAHCKSRAYIIHLVWRQSGWYYEHPDTSGLIGPRDMSNEGKKLFIEAIINSEQAEKRILIVP